MTDVPPPVPQPKRRSGLPKVAWIGIGVAGLMMVGLIGYGVYFGFGLAKATSEFVEQYHATLEEVSADFDRWYDSGGTDLSSIDTEADIEQRLAILEDLSGHLGIALADATTGDRFAAKLRENGMPESVVEGAIEGFVEV